MQGDFTVNFTEKKGKIGTRNLYLTENWFSRNEMWCAADIHNRGRLAPQTGRGKNIKAALLTMAA